MTEPTAAPRPAGRHPARQQLAGWALVAVQAALLVALVWPVAARWDPPSWLRLLGAALRVVGLVVSAAGIVGLGGSLTPSPVPKATAVLATGGLYRWVRHPIYSGLLAFALGSVLSAPHPGRAAAAVGLFALLQVKSRWEERLLTRSLAGYGDYAASVGRFLPRLR